MIPHFGLRRQYIKLKDQLLDASDRVLSSGTLVGGQYTSEFEDWLSNRTNTAHAITCHSGTQALEIIARYTKIQFERENGNYFRQPLVRIPNLTYPATLNAFINAGYIVELVDTDRYGMLIPSRWLRRQTASREFDCIVGLYGARPPVTWEWNLSRIVDGAQHWLVANDTGIGMSISFDPTKNLPSSGNGGAIVTDLDDLAVFARNYRSNSMLNGNTQSGTNSKMSEQDCAQILVRTEYIDEWQRRREQIKKYWCAAFKDIPLRCMSDGIEHHANQKFVVYTDDRASLSEYLGSKGIECKIHYPYTLSELPVSASFKRPDMVSTSVMLSRGVLSLPMYPELTDGEVEHISESVINYYK